MMMRARHVGFSLWLLLGLTACRQDGLDPEDAALLEQAPAGQAKGEAATQAPATSPQIAAPVVHATVLADNAVAVGSEVSAEGKVVAAKPVYGLADAVYASVPVTGHPAGKTVTIYWFGADGTSVKTESRQTKAGETFVSFALRQADGMKAGAHSAQVDIDDVPVGMADFRVQ